MHYPQILSWLSARAGIDETRGQAIWDSIIAEARLRYTEPEIGSASYWEEVVTELHRRLAIEASLNGRNDWLDNPHDAPPFTAMLDFQTTLLTRLMLGWRDVAIASTRTWSEYCGKDLAA